MYHVSSMEMAKFLQLLVKCRVKAGALGKERIRLVNPEISFTYRKIWKSVILSSMSDLV